MRLNRVSAGLSAGFCLLLAACGGSGGPGPRPASAVPSRNGGADVSRALEALNGGDANGARKLLKGVLKRDPGNAVAAKLMSEIETDPVTLLGRESYAYVAHEGDTMSTLAARFLGSPLLAYALARYNGIDVPASLRAGRALRIPGKERAAPPPPPEPKPEPVVEKAPSPRPKRPTPPPAAPAPPPPPTAPVVNPARAAQLRARALEQMNRGAIQPAVALLEQALRLDPANPLIKRDLERALRIRQAVGAKPR